MRFPRMQSRKFDQFLGWFAEPERVSESCYRLGLAAALGPERCLLTLQPLRNALIRGRSSELIHVAGC